MRYIVGLDIGTASCGIAAFEIDQNNKPKKLIHISSYIFREPLNPKNFISLNKNRRDKRLVRRQSQRKKSRIKAIYLTAKEMGISKEDIKKNQASGSRIRIEGIIKDASRKEISLVNLFIYLLYRTKHRGYKGRLTRDIRVRLSQENEEKGGLRLRKDLESEFDGVIKEQEKHHPILNKDAPQSYLKKNKSPKDNFKDKLKEIIFYQRPIKWDINTIGKCSVYQEKEVASTASLIYEEYRVATVLKI